MAIPTTHRAGSDTDDALPNPPKTRPKPTMRRLVTPQSDDAMQEPAHITNESQKPGILAGLFQDKRYQDLIKSVTNYKVSALFILSFSA